MASPFVPLQRSVAASGSGTGSNPEPSAKFRPLGAPQNAPGLPSASAKSEAAIMAALAAKFDLAAAATASNTAGQTHQQVGPVITAKKQGDVITHIVIRCSCGAVTEIECSY